MSSSIKLNVFLFQYPARQNQYRLQNSNPITQNFPCTCTEIELDIRISQDSGTVIKLFP